MYIKTRAIVISSLKYQEKNLIVKCFTLSHGIKSYFVRNVFLSKKSPQKIAFFQPLSFLEIEAFHRNKGALESFKELKINAPFHSIRSNIYKSTITLFVSEVLNSAIVEEEKNEDLFLFLETALFWLDSHDYISNFHIILLLEMSKFMGFYPAEILDLSFFDMNEGVFVEHKSINSLSEQETKLLKKSLELKFETKEKIFNSSERQVLLRIIMDYYSIHLSGFRKPKSLEVLKTIFNDN